MAVFRLEPYITITLHPGDADALRYALEAQEHCNIEIMDERAQGYSEYLFKVAPHRGVYPNGVNPTHWTNFSNWLQRFLSGL